MRRMSSSVPAASPTSSALHLQRWVSRCSDGALLSLFPLPRTRLHKRPCDEGEVGKSFLPFVDNGFTPSRSVRINLSRERVRRILVNLYLLTERFVRDL